MAETQAKTGVLLLNLGTPDSTEVSDVRRYLREFLSDPRVLDLPALGRWMLLNLIILPFRPKKSAEAYKEIWTEDGSPLKLFTEQLTAAVQAKIGERHTVRYAMRYQNPSMRDVMEAFRAEGTERIVVVPLYPQYASSSTGSCLEKLYQVAGELWNAPSLSVVPAFYEHPAFIQASAQVARETLGDLDQYDCFLFSYHGLPERHVKKSDLNGGNYCLSREDCCAEITDVNRYCYRAQSFATTRALAAELGIPHEKYRVAFQSRLGRTPWIQPYTDKVVEEFPKKGIKKIAVLVPSFTADCLETIEEIGMRAREDFEKAGGESLTLVPCLNAHPAWVDAVCQIIDEQGVAITV